MGTKVYL